ncbi:MAG: hypothetical protein WC728_01650 [Elusimicrobiota bacterium]
MLSQTTDRVLRLLAALWRGFWVYFLASGVCCMAAFVLAEGVKQSMGLSYPYPFVLQAPTKVALGLWLGAFAAALAASMRHGGSGWGWGTFFGIFSGVGIAFGILRVPVIAGGYLPAFCYGLLAIPFGVAGGRIGDWAAREIQSAIQAPPDLTPRVEALEKRIAVLEAAFQSKPTVQP